MTPGLVIADDPKTVEELERLSSDPANGIGRRIAPRNGAGSNRIRPVPAAAYEPANSFLFSPMPTQGRYGKPFEVGTHGLWPGRPGYRSVFLLWGNGIPAERRPEMAITEIYPRLKSLLGLR